LIVVNAAQIKGGSRRKDGHEGFDVAGGQLPIRAAQRASVVPDEEQHEWRA